MSSFPEMCYDPEILSKQGWYSRNLQQSDLLQAGLNMSAQNNLHGFVARFSVALLPRWPVC